MGRFVLVRMLEYWKDLESSMVGKFHWDMVCMLDEAVWEQFLVGKCLLDRVFLRDKVVRVSGLLEWGVVLYTQCHLYILHRKVWVE